ncbi:unnamed protein product [Ixodes pacificus]
MAFSVRSGRAFSLKRSANETYVKYKNKCDELQKHLQVPLFDENEAPFAPTIDEMKRAESIFVSNRNHTISFIKSAVRPHQYPDHDLPEVAVLGVSNVGKSSLLQALFHKVPDVRVKVSKKPVCVLPPSRVLFSRKKFKINTLVINQSLDQTLLREGLIPLGHLGLWHVSTKTSIRYPRD